MRMKGFALLSLLLVFALLLPACTPQVVEVPVQVVQTVIVEKEVPVEKVVTPTPAPAVGGGTLTIAVTGDIDNFDPHWNQLIMYEVLVGHNLFNYLVRLSPDMRIRPDLAESWDISDDGKTYTFHLRPGAKFHNGQPVTAEDVIFSFNRTIEQKMTFASKLESIESMEASDAHTLNITTKDIWAPFLDDIAVIAIVPQGSGDELRMEPVGSGPFMFKEWAPNDHITLVKNPDYDVPGQPLLDQIIIKVLPDYTVALTNLEAGQVNAVYEVPASAAARFRGRDDIVFQTPGSTNSLRLIEFTPNSYEPLKDTRVLQALAMCMNKEAIQQIVYFGEGDVQWSSLPKSSWAYIEPEGPTYDPAAAKALLAEAGYPNGFDLEIEIISGSSVMENIATIWQEGLAEAGVNLKINSQELSSWLDKYVNLNYQSILNSMNVRSDPHSMYDIIFRKHWNSDTSFPRPDMLQALEEGATTLDEGRRKAIYAKMQQVAVEEMAPILIVQSQPLIALTSPKVKGWAMNGKNDIFFESIYVEE